MSSRSRSPTVPFPATGQSLEPTQHVFKLYDHPQQEPLSIRAPSTPVAGPSSARTPSVAPNGKETRLVVPPPRPRPTKLRTKEEIDLTSHAAARVASALAADHVGALYPDVDTPFSDGADVVQRLFPYHVFQLPEEDRHFKGKRRADPDDLAQEVKDTRFALRCTKRLRNLEHRFRSARVKSGERPSTDAPSFILAQMMLEDERAEHTATNAELRTARAELDRLEREKRAAFSQQRPAFYSHYSATQNQFYQRGLPYAYVPSPNTPTQAGSLTGTPVASYAIPGASTTAVAPAPTPSTGLPLHAGGHIPVSLPLLSLPALHQLGIYPVSAEQLPPSNQPQPPAILLGTTHNGQLLNLQINVSMLQTAQINGLALIMNSIMAKTGPGGGGTTVQTVPIQPAVAQVITPQQGTSSAATASPQTATPPAPASVQPSSGHAPPPQAASGSASKPMSPAEGSKPSAKSNT